MTDQKPTTAHTIEFHRKDWANSRYPYLVATTRTEDPNAPVELVRPYSDGSGDEVLVSLTAAEWSELVVFLAQHSVSVISVLEELERRGAFATDQGARPRGNADSALATTEQESERA